MLLITCNLVMSSHLLSSRSYHGHALPPSMPIHSPHPTITVAMIHRTSTETSVTDHRFKASFCQLVLHSDPASSAIHSILYPSLHRPVFDIAPWPTVFNSTTHVSTSHCLTYPHTWISAVCPTLTANQCRERDVHRPLCENNTPKASEKPWHCANPRIITACYVTVTTIL